MKEIWPMIMEKAWAKLHGSFECTDAGENHDALAYLTGGVIKVLNTSRKESSHFKILADALSEKDNEDAFVGCGDCGYAQPKSDKSAGCRRVGLVTSHAYALLRVLDEADTGVRGLRMVQVQNPWGNTEWNGKFSDKCPHWTPELKRKVGFSEAKNDGTFYMEWEDFISWFGQCRIVDPRHLDRLSEGSLAQIDGGAANWVAGMTAGGPLDRYPHSFPFNPTFELTGGDSDHDSDVMLSLYRPDTRVLAIYDTWPIMQGQCKEVSVWFGERGYQKSKVLSVLKDDRVGTTSVGTVRIRRGRVYEITVAAAAPGIEGAFSFTACGREVKLIPCQFNTPPSNISALMAKRGDFLSLEFMFLATF